MHVLLTGLRHVGKTTLCQAVVALARARGLEVQGVVTPALKDSAGAKVGFEALDARTGERWLLAHTEKALGGPQVGPYAFDSAGLERCLATLQQAIAAEPDLLIVDEIGPLELERGGGFAPILDHLDLHGQTQVLLVVRPSLLAALRRRLSFTDFVIYTVTEHNRDKLAELVVEQLSVHR